MKKLLRVPLFLIPAVFIASIGMMPLQASAHALPVDSSPESSAVLDTAPTSVDIRFSEHVDVSASTVHVAGPSGTDVTVGAVSASADRFTLSVPVKADTDGTYIVSWSAVSADDGHFTKGAFPYAVGQGAAIGSVGSSEEIVEVATTPEAISSSIELMGHGFLWAALLLFAFAIRPLLSGTRFADQGPLVRRIVRWWIYIGIVLAFVGGLLQMLIKASDLASLQTIPFAEAFFKYIPTSAGSATAGRMLAIVVFAALFLFGARTIQAAKRMTPYEYLLIAALCCFAYLRAKISHATSNPFHPEFSISVNFLHVIEKDIWAGVVGILLIFCLSRRLRDFLMALIPGAFAMLAIDFGAVSVTACYIVWLHLKTFDNLFTTQWGAAFLELLIAAVLVVGMRFYHVLARLWRPAIFARFLPSTLAIEFAFGMLVVYFSSVVIITSPPLGVPPTPVFRASDQGASIVLARDAYEDGMLSLSIAGAHMSTTTTPVLTVQESGDPEAISITLSKRYAGGYVFPESLLAGTGPFTAMVTAPQSGAYDAHTSFEIPKGAFDVPSGWESRRAFDAFTIIMIAIAVAAFATAVLLFYLSGLPSDFVSVRHNDFTAFIAILSFLVAAFCATALIGAFHASGFENPFRTRCEGDGNMWHVMQPMKAGVPTSEMPAEGCMWGMGEQMYMFPDQREYDAYATLPHAEVSLTHTPTRISAGIPVTLTVSLKEPDGSPASLFVDMEKLIHVVIVSSDESVFAHIHPDDVHPLTAQEVTSSTFTVNYTFPKSGTYLVSFDYAHGLSLESEQFTVDVVGAPVQSKTARIYQSPGMFNGYSVALDPGQPFAGEISTLRYTISKDGKPVTDIVPYLSAAMHISVVKNDFSTFIHIHGEVHPPGTPLPPIIVKNGQVLHSMAMMVTPPTFGPLIEGHVIFPTSGLYTVWGEFKVGSTVIPTSFTVKVQ